MGLWLSQVEHRTLNPAVGGSNPSRPAYHTPPKIDPRGGNPYERFRDSIRDSETGRKYRICLRQFLDGVPGNVYMKAYGGGAAAWPYPCIENETKSSTAVNRTKRTGGERRRAPNTVHGADSRI